MPHFNRLRGKIKGSTSYRARFKVSDVVQHRPGDFNHEDHEEHEGTKEEGKRKQGERGAIIDGAKFGWIPQEKENRTPSRQVAKPERGRGKGAKGQSKKGGDPPSMRPGLVFD